MTLACKLGFRNQSFDICTFLRFNFRIYAQSPPPFSFNEIKIRAEFTWFETNSSRIPAETVSSSVGIRLAR